MNETKDIEKEFGERAADFQTLASLIMSGGLGERAKSEMTQEINKNPGFLAWWQRKEGEPITSRDNLLKAIGLVAGYAVCKRINPWKESSTANAILLIAASALGTLLVIPGQGKEFRTELMKVYGFGILLILGCVKSNLKEHSKIISWGDGFSRQQRAIIALMLNLIANDMEENGNRLDILGHLIADAGVRDAITCLISDNAKHYDELGEVFINAQKGYLLETADLDEKIAPGLAMIRASIK